jgi:molybdenum cofactor biosynthesis enzyme MoaA
MSQSDPLMNTGKNRDREAYSFANINLLGKCNVDCFFCLGKDLEEELRPHNQLKVPVADLKNLPEFLKLCRRHGVQKLYITGQNTDSLLYAHLEELIKFFHDRGFMVGLRTNGYLAGRKMSVINQCDLSVGYSIHTLNPVTNKMIMGRDDFPDWETIIPATRNPRVSIVLTRCNEFEFYDLLKFTAKFLGHVRYIQVRRPSTDTRRQLLTPDMVAYERVYTQVANIFGPPKKRLWADAEVFEIYGQEVVFWRTVKTSVNSLNYFTDGTISDVYFVVEGYLKYREQE